jgi:hypothetical protein
MQPGIVTPNNTPQLFVGLSSIMHVAFRLFFWDYLVVSSIAIHRVAVISSSLAYHSELKQDGAGYPESSREGGES